MNIIQSLGRGAVSLLLLLGLPIPMQAQSSTDTLRLSMREALEIGLERGTKLQVAQLEIRRADQDYRKSRGGLLPQVNLSGAYSNMLKKQRVYFDLEDGSSSSSPMSKFFPEDGIEMGQTHSIQAGVQAAVPLVAPQLWASLGLSARAVDLARERARGSRVAQRSEIRKAYLAALLAVKVHETLQASHRAIQQAYEQISQQYERGLVAEYDKIRMGTQEWNVRSELFRAQRSIDLAEMKLKTLMALPLDTPIILTEDLDSYASLLSPERLQQTEDIRLDQNTTLGELDGQLAQLRQAIKLKRMAFMPTLSASFIYQYSFASNLFKLDNSRRWSPFSTLGLTLSIPLYSGGSRIYDLRSSRTQLEQLNLSRRQAELELDLALKAAKVERNSAFAQYSASRAALESAIRGLEIAQARYRVGESTLVELNDAEMALRQARLGCSQAIYSFMTALITLEQLEGREAIESEVWSH